MKTLSAMVVMVVLALSLFGMHGAASADSPVVYGADLTLGGYSIGRTAQYLTLTVANIGNKAAGPFAVFVYSEVDGTLIHTKWIAGLNAQGQPGDRYTWSFFPSKPGCLRVVIDPLQQVGEIFENNNISVVCP